MSEGKNSEIEGAFLDINDFKINSDFHQIRIVKSSLSNPYAHFKQPFALTTEAISFLKIAIMEATMELGLFVFSIAERNSSFPLIILDRFWFRGTAGVDVTTQGVFFVD